MSENNPQPAPPEQPLPEQSAEQPLPEQASEQTPLEQVHEQQAAHPSPLEMVRQQQTVQQANLAAAREQQSARQHDEDVRERHPDPKTEHLPSTGKPGQSPSQRRTQPQRQLG